MKIRWEKSTRLVTHRAWIWLLIAGWLGLVVLYHFLAQEVPGESTICMFKRLTGKACIFCGLTRGSLAILRCDLSGLGYNPLMLTAFISLVSCTILRFVTGRRIRLIASRREKIALICIATLCVFINWAYLIYAGI